MTFFNRTSQLVYTLARVIWPVIRIIVLVVERTKIIIGCN